MDLGAPRNQAQEEDAQPMWFRTGMTALSTPKVWEGAMKVLRNSGFKMGG